MRTYVFKIKYFYKKNIFRKIEVLGDISLYKLAKAITSAYDFDFDHCFGFYSNTKNEYYHDSEKQYELFADLPDVEPTEADSVKKTKIFKVWKNSGDKMMFLFDYGDCWMFIVELIGFGERGDKEKYPKLLEAKGEDLEQYPDYDEE